MKFEIATLDDGWHDMDTVMFHAAFQCLVNWVEEEQGLTHCDYEAHKEDIDECRLLYNWWKENNGDAWIGQDNNDKLQRLVKVSGFLWT